LDVDRAASYTALDPGHLSGAVRLVDLPVGKGQSTDLVESGGDIFDRYDVRPVGLVLVLVLALNRFLARRIEAGPMTTAEELDGR
jgi:hypothetical protein